MKIKTICKKYFFTKYFLAGCFFVLTFLNFSCGLDTYYEIEAPTTVLHEPSYNSAYDERYFTFMTNEAINSANQGFSFTGTNVYYRIYDDISELNRDRSNLQSMATSNDINAINSAAFSLIQPKGSGYGYCLLNTVEERESSTLIPSAALDRRIKIRLTNYGAVYEFRSYIDIEDGPTYTPLRENGKSFDFGRDGSRDAIPVQGDIDYSYSSSGTGIKYVALYALAIGHDASYSNYYSTISYIGTVSIDPSIPDN